MSKYSPRTKWLVSIIGILVLVFIVLPLLISLKYKRWEVNGPSMDPTYTNGQYILATKSDTNPTIGSVVVIRTPSPQGKTIDSIKRIVALGGDRVVINHLTLTVYDKQHPNGYNPTSGVLPKKVQTSGHIEVTIPKGDVYVLGDNRPDSWDSRDFGPLPKSDIVGKVVQS